MDADRIDLNTAVYGNGGNDFIATGSGNDYVEGGSGNYAVYWNPPGVFDLCIDALPDQVYQATLYDNIWQEKLACEKMLSFICPQQPHYSRTEQIVTYM